MICITHGRDLDGWASGAIMKLKYPTATIIEYDYGEPYPNIPTGQEVIMADVSMPMDKMYEIAKNSGFKFTWIDHHVSAFKDYEEFSAGKDKWCNAILDNKISACEGTWKYLFPDMPTPKAITLLGEYDTFRKSEHWDTDVMPFQFGMRAICNSVKSFPTTVLSPEGFSQMAPSIMKDGRAILQYQAQVNEADCKRSFPFTFEGFRCICLNTSTFSSDAFKTCYDPEKYDIMMPFRFNGKEWAFSLYTTKDIDCSAIAKRYGGGGHAKASGFMIPNINEFFKLNKNMDTDNITSIAKVCHQANKAWCESNGDATQQDWDSAAQWQRDSAIDGVKFRLSNPDAGKDSQHNAWMDDKVKNGWVYGEEKNADKKTHPCIVPFDKLPEFQQKKNALFCAIVDALK